MKTEITPFMELETKKSAKSDPTTAEEDAAVLAMSATGARESEISKATGRTTRWVTYRKKKMASEIAEFRKNIVEDMAEDFTDIISLTIYRLRCWLTDDDFAIWIPPRDLAQILKTVFTARQSMLRPYDIPGIPRTEIQGRDEIDRLAVANDFNRNFENLQRAAIMGETIEAEEGDFVESPD